MSDKQPKSPRKTLKKDAKITAPVERVEPQFTRVAEALKTNTRVKRKVTPSKALTAALDSIDQLVAETIKDVRAAPEITAQPAPEPVPEPTPEPAATAAAQETVQEPDQATKEVIAEQAQPLHFDITDAFQEAIARQVMTPAEPVDDSDRPVLTSIPVIHVFQSAPNTHPDLHAEEHQNHLMRVIPDKPEPILLLSEDGYHEEDAGLPEQWPIKGKHPDGQPYTGTAYRHDAQRMRAHDAEKKRMQNIKDMAKQGASIVMDIKGYSPEALNTLRELAQDGCKIVHYAHYKSIGHKVPTVLGQAGPYPWDEHIDSLWMFKEMAEIADEIHFYYQAGEEDPQLAFGVINQRESAAHLMSELSASISQSNPEPLLSHLTETEKSDGAVALHLMPLPAPDLWHRDRQYTVTPELPKMLARMHMEAVQANTRSVALADLTPVQRYDLPRVIKAVATEVKKLTGNDVGRKSMFDKAEMAKLALKPPRVA